MMRDRCIEFVDHHMVTTMVEIMGAYKLQPTGRLAWLQRLCWKVLHRMGALAQAYEPKMQVTRHVIQADKFMDRLLQQRKSMVVNWNREPKRLLIGSDDYAELMCAPEVIGRGFNFLTEMWRSDGGRPRIVGLEVEVIPWMRGMLVMP